MRIQNAFRLASVAGLLAGFAADGRAAQSDASADAKVRAEVSAEQSASDKGSRARAGQSVESMATARARLTKGELGPRSKPGDRAVFRLQEDARTGADVVLEKGTEIVGTVQSVSRTEIESEDGRASERAVIHVLWEAAAQGDVPGDGAVAITMDALTFVHPLARAAAESEAVGRVGASAAGRAPSGGGSSGGLIGGVTSTVEGVAGATAGAAGATVGSAAELGATAVGAASLDALAAGGPSAVDATTSGSVLGSLGISGAEAGAAGLFQVGQGLAVSPQGDTEQLQLMTRFANDTILTAPAKGTQIGSGAQARMLIAVDS
jgi:hypothetical protein